MPNTPSLQKIRWKLFLLGLFKIPMIHFVRPRLIEIDETKAVIKVSLRRRSRNHLNSMYFGALAVGADVAAGIHVYYFAEQENLTVAFAFKSMKADFLSRAETDVTFVCEDGVKIQEIIQLSKNQQSRMNQVVSVKAFDVSKNVVAEFEMEVSVKVK